MCKTPVPEQVNRRPPSFEQTRTPPAGMVWLPRGNVTNSKSQGVKRLGLRRVLGLEFIKRPGRAAPIYVAPVVRPSSRPSHGFLVEVDEAYLAHTDRDSLFFPAWGRKNNTSKVL